MASEMLITGMKLGRRWLYVLWIASTVLWHQAGAAPSPVKLAEIPQWDAGNDDERPPFTDFTVQGDDSLENQDLAKRTTASTACVESFAGFEMAALITVGTLSHELPQGKSATEFAWLLIRGPPAGA